MKLLQGQEPEIYDEQQETRRERVLRVLYYLAIFVVICLMLRGCGDPAWSAEPSYTLDQWANAIRKAEGNPNYGILAHYKHTSYRQACKNTVKHIFREYEASDTKEPFIDFLASKYAPIGASNDPTGLNRNWARNVQYFLNKEAI